ncbi:cell division protein FtsA [bacterium]|nr:cell division protein FtsA [bacterium]
MCAIDIGTTKICALIAQQVANGELQILGIGKVPSDGLRKGVVVDIARTIVSIKKAIEEAELMAGTTMHSVVIGISGGHIQSRNAYGAAPIARGEVTQEDIARTIAAARAIQLPEGQQVLHVLPQYFSIDGQDRIQDPLGMHGIRLEVQVHIITGAISSVQNLIKCCQMAGVKVQDVVLEQLASALAVLNDDERELGVAMLDIGGGTSDLALYQGGTIRHTMVVPIAGNLFTSDLAVGLRTTIKDAERIKREYGLVNLDLLGQDKEIEVEMVQGGKTRMIMQTEVFDILEPRAQELLSIVHEEILGRNLTHLLVSGFVLTGGGALLEGMKEVTEDILDVPVRIGKPQSTQAGLEMLQSPIFATAYGLLLYAAKQQGVGSFSEEDNGVSRLLMRMKSWVSDFF